MAKEAERLLAETGWLPEPLRPIDDAEASTPEVEAGGEDGDAALPAFLAGDDEEVTAEANDDEPHLVAAE
jgi:ParB family chromosome partitioning protein